MLDFIQKLVTPKSENLDFQEIEDDVEDLPAHLIPNEQMTQLFINNCKEMGMWE